MIFIETLKHNLKRLLHQKVLVLMTFVLPLSVLLIISFIVENGERVNYIYMVNNDNESISEEYIEKLEKDKNIKVCDEEIGVNKVKNKIINCVYEIPEGFSDSIKNGESPKINIMSIDDESYEGDFQYESTNIIDNLILKEDMKSRGIDISYEELESSSTITTEDNSSNNGTDKILLNILVSFIFFASITVGTELYDLKNQNILKRSFISGNSERKIIASVLTALFIIYSLCYSTVYIIQVFIRKSEMMSKLPYVLVNLLCLSFVSICLGIFLVRISKNESTIPLWGQGISWITCFIGGSFMPLELLPDKIKLFAKFTPQYWALESINSENLFLSFIVILFGIAFFTAGTVKYKKIVMD